MKPIERKYWPEWLQRLKMPWRCIAGRVEDVGTFCSIYPATRNHCFHYTSAGHVESVVTPWPFLLIETAPEDFVAAWLADQVLAGVYRMGNDVIRIPRCVLNREPFPLETSLVASTLVEIARKKVREDRKTNKRLAKNKVVATQILSLDESAQR